MAASRRIALAAVVVLFAATWIRPIWPVEQALHSSLTVVALGLLYTYARRGTTRNSDFILLCVFLALHCVASRWLYSNVPYGEWCQRLLGLSPQALFGWHRNHFDRLVHFAYGACLTPAFAHSLALRYPLSRRQGFALALLLIMASSLVYEWIEWAVALTMSPHDAEAYNGQQGDMWDAHADMLMATVGAVVQGPWLVRSRT
ncbi:DUF2238 domain-containing protein [Lysobacter sp. HA35]